MTLTWLAAFLCSLFLVNAWQLEFFLGAVLLVFVWSCACLFKGLETGWEIPKSAVLAFAGGFWALAFLSVFRSELPFVSLSAFCFFSVMPLSFLVFILCRDEEALKKTGYVLAAVFAGLALWALIQFIFLNEYFEGRVRHPLANPNALAALFNLALFPAMGWMCVAPNKRQAFMALGLCVLLVGGIMATGSRGALLSAFPALFVFLVFGWHRVKTHWRILSLLGISAIALFFLSSLGNTYYEAMAWRVMDTVRLVPDDISNNRLNIWAGTWLMIKDHWLLGTGIGTFFLYYPEYRLPQDMTGAISSHSDPLQYWAEMGLFSLLLFYGFTAAVLVRTFRALAAIPKDSVLRIAVLAPFCGISAVVVHTHVTFNLYNISILFGVGFLLSVWFLATGKVLKDRRFKVSFPATLPLSVKQFVVMLPFLSIGFLLSTYIVSEHFVNRARDNIFEGDLNAFAGNIERANIIGLQSNYRAYILAVNVPLGILQESGNTLSEEQKKDLYDQATLILKRAQYLNPRSASALYYQAKLQTLVPASFLPADAPGKEKLYARTLRLDPLHLGARMALANEMYDKGDLGGAFALLKEGMDYKYNSPLALGFYGRLLLMSIEADDKETQRLAGNKMVRFKKLMDSSYKKQNTTIGRQLFGAEDVLGP